MAGTYRHATVIADTTKAQNTDVLAADVTPKFGVGYFRVTLAADAAVKALVVPSSGSSFYLNNGDALVADAVIVNEFGFDAEGGRTFNIQSDDGAGITVTHMMIDQVVE